MQMPKSTAPVMAGLGTVFSVLALSLNRWEHRNKLTGGSRMGLWKACADGECQDVPDRSAFDTVKALMFLGLFCMLGTLVLSILSSVFLTANTIIENLTLVISATAATSLMTGFSVYAESIKLPPDNTEYGASFALAVMASILAWGVTAIHIHRKYSDPPTPPVEKKKYVYDKDNSAVVSMEISEYATPAKGQMKNEN